MNDRAYRQVLGLREGAPLPRRRTLLFAVGLALLLSASTVGQSAGPSTRIAPLADPLPHGPTHPYGTSTAALNWTALATPSGPEPAPRCCDAVAYDPAEGYTLEFGGTGACGSCNDTWSYEAGVWTNLTPTLKLSPSGRAWASMVYDPVLDAVVLFGGLLFSTGTTTTALSDTWEFRQGQWQPLPTIQSPPARWSAGMAFDPWLGGLVLFGGFNPVLGYLGDTWELTNGTWSSVTTPVAPSPRWTPELVFDSVDRYLLLYGGFSATTGMLGDTWAFEDGGWLELSAAASPPPREKAVMVEDPTLPGVVLMGGDVCRPSCGPGAYTADLNDTWTYAGGAWTNVTGSLTQSPPARCCGAAVYDPGTAQVLLFSGSGPTGLQSNVWELSAQHPGPLAFTYAEAIPSTIPLGGSSTLAVGVEGAHGAVSYVYAGLPPGCTGSNTSELGCTPTAAGSFSIAVVVRDTSGNSSTTSVEFNATTVIQNGTQGPASAPRAPIGSPDLGFATGAVLLGVALVVGLRNSWRRR